MFAALLIVGIAAFHLGATRAKHNATEATREVASNAAPQLPTPVPPAAGLPGTQTAGPESSEQVNERALGHAAFADGRPLAALRHYDRALSIDRHAVDRQMIENMIACYGHRRTQPEAATVIVRWHLGDAATALRTLARDGRTHGTRAGARFTLEKLGHPVRDYVVREGKRTAS
jgi:hypothetical protein